MGDEARFDEAIYEKLLSLSDGQFEEVIARIAPGHYLPGKQASRTERALELIRLCGQQGVEGASRLGEAISKVLRASPRRSSPRPIGPALEPQRQNDESDTRSASWSDDRVVALWSCRPKSEELLGTGAIVAPKRVLTARHVVFGANGKPRSGLTLRGGDWNRKVKVVWDGGDALDVALLAFEGDDPVEHRAAMVLESRAIKAHEKWSAAGYPEVDRNEPEEGETPHQGTTYAWSLSKKSHRVHLLAEGNPNEWGGFSGAAIVVEGRVIAVATEMPKGYRKTRLYATPVARFWDEPNFRRALGPPVASDGRQAARVREIEAKFAATLGAHEAIRSLMIEELARLKETATDASEVASRLVRKLRANDVALLFNRVHDRLRVKGAREAGEAWGMLCELLPILADWEPLVKRQGEAREDGPKVITLNLRHTTITEIVMARLESRCCHFAMRDGVPEGDAMLKAPQEHLYIDPEGKRRTTLLAADLARTLPSLVARDVARRRSLRSLSDEDVVSDVRGELTVLLNEYGDKKRRYYVVYLKEDLQGFDDPERFWELAARDMNEQLPEVTLVRLVGAADPGHATIRSALQFILTRKPEAP
jgi:hypothetical protein